MKLWLTKDIDGKYWLWDSKPKWNQSRDYWQGNNGFGVRSKIDDEQFINTSGGPKSIWRVQLGELKEDDNG